MHQAVPIPSLAYSLSPPDADAVSDVVGTCNAYSEQAQFLLFPKLKSNPPSPSTVFEPEDLGLYAKIKTGDARDGLEAGIIWNAGFNIEMALAAVHKVTEAVAEGECSIMPSLVG
jgi:hypothetical protein